MKYVQWFSWCVNLPLQVALLNSLFRGGFRSFPVLLPYSLILFLSTVANIAAREGGSLPAAWQSAYWVVELILELAPVRADPVTGKPRCAAEPAPGEDCSAG